MDARIGLFPLNTVLFPGVLLRLHIFEDRYKEMIGGCIENGAPFGVVLDRRAGEVGAEIDPAAVGTTAELREVTPLPQGRLFIVTRGVRRFRVNKMVAGTPFLSAEISYLEEPLGPSEPTQRLRDAVVERFRYYLRMLLSASGPELQRLQLPDDAALTSYLIADALQIAAPLKQRLLEAEFAGQRLQVELKIIESEIRRLRDRRPQQGLPLNPSPFNVRFSLN